MAILEVEDIHTYYGDAYVLQGLSLKLEEGTILGLLGRNGVGKTTLVKSLVGFNPPRRGRILFKGVDVTSQRSFDTVRSGMGLVPQGRRVFPSLTVEENLDVAERGDGRRGWTAERVYALFPRLRERRGQRAKTLSGGEQQMLAIGRGLMTNPDCLIMDEPSEGLAPIIIQGVWEAIGKLKREGLSILLVEQNAALALKLVDHVPVMSKGRVVYSGSPQQLWADYAARLASLPTTREVHLGERNAARIVQLRGIDLTLDELCGDKRSQNIVYPRQVAMYLSRELTDASLPKIGKEFGGRDHTTVLHANAKILRLIREDRSVYNLVQELTARVKQNR